LYFILPYKRIIISNLGYHDLQPGVFPRPAGYFPPPSDVKLSDHPLTIVQPDIMIVCDKDRLEENRCNGAPDFFKTVSSSRRFLLICRRFLWYTDTMIMAFRMSTPGRRLSPWTTKHLE
jgi:hypothetical protein